MYPHSATFAVTDLQLNGDFLLCTHIFDTHLLYKIHKIYPTHSKTF
jgi:hypothetical protein